MKFPKPMQLLLLLIGLAVFGGLTACHTGTKARDEIMAPAIALSSDGFESDVFAGIAALPLDEQDDASIIAGVYFNAVRSQDLGRVVSEARPVWPTVRGWAERGVAEKLIMNVIGPLGAQSKFERIQNIEDALSQTTGAFGG